MEYQSLVEDYLASGGKVKNVPRGESGLPKMRWIPSGGDSGQLREIGKDGNPISAAEYKAKLKRQNRRNIEAVKRRNQFVALASWCTVDEIAEKTGWSRRCVEDHLRRAGVTAKPVDTLLRLEKSRRIRAEVKSEYNQGNRKSHSIAKKLGRSEKTVRNHLKAIMAGQHGT